MEISPKDVGIIIVLIISLFQEYNGKAKHTSYQCYSCNNNTGWTILSLFSTIFSAEFLSKVTFVETSCSIWVLLIWRLLLSCVEVVGVSDEQVCMSREDF